MGPKLTLKMHETQKRKNTPAPDRAFLREPVALVTWEPMAASQMSAMLIAIVPKRSGFLRPTRSRTKEMKIRLQSGPTTL
jgi:hypothetical protein